MLIIKTLEKQKSGKLERKKNKAYRWVITVPELLVILTGLWVIYERAFCSQLPFYF